jgi:glycosyltransferase involved in cell wall biosynthesis
VSVLNKSRFPWNEVNTLHWANSFYPRLSVIVPSFNQGEYIEETLLSIINQHYPNLELIVIDGGSTDNSVDIIRKYSDKITYWVSEKDRGQSHAINKGIEQATGEWIAWMNSDDCYLEGALHYIFSELDLQGYDFLYGQCFSGAYLTTAIEKRHPVNAKRDLKDILRFFFNVSHIIPSQSVFVRRNLISDVGILNEGLHYCMDLDWYCRIYIKTQDRLFYKKTICFYRTNSDTKTGSIENKGPEESMQIALKYARYLSTKDSKELTKLVRYFKLLRRYILSGKSSLTKLLMIGFMYPFISINHISYRVQLRKCFNSLR